MKTVIYFSMPTEGEQPSPRIQMISRKRESSLTACFFEESSLIIIHPRVFCAIFFDLIVKTCPSIKIRDVVFKKDPPNLVTRVYL